MTAATAANGVCPSWAGALHLCLLLPHLRLGGIEKGLCNLVGPLAARGWRVTLVLQSRTGELLEALPPGQPVHDLGGRPFGGAVGAMARLLRAEEFDILYSATNVTNLIALAALRRSRRRSRVAAAISEHTPLGLFLDRAKRRWLRIAMMRALYPSAQALCAPLAEIGEEHRALLGGRCPPFHVLPNPVVAGLAPWRPVAARADRLIAIGRLSAEKRFDLAIRAFAGLYRARGAARLTIHGEGPERRRLEQLRDSLGLAQAVALPGATHDIAGALSQADGLLCTSEREGLGNAIIEAQAAGVPVLSVDCPFGPRHLLRGGEAGCLVSGDDPATLEEALRRFHGDAKARAGWREVAADVARSYSIDNAAAAHDCLFRAVVAGQRERAQQ